MKKKIGYVILILISILGSRLIFGKDYHLNSNNMMENNLYLYDIFERKKETLEFIDNEYLYYIVSSNKPKEYKVIKHDLISNKIVNEYSFNSFDELKNIKLFMADNSIYLTSLNSNVFYELNKNLELITYYTTNNNGYDSFGVFNNQFISTKGNEIYYENNIYDTLPNSCGKNIEMLYNKEMYLHFHNNDTGFGCLYNFSSKKREYLDYEKALIVNDKLLEYQENRQSFKYNGTTYYFNDITESNNLIMHVNGDYLFTIDMTNNYLNIYNIETQKKIYERMFLELRNGEINDILIDDYAYFTVTKNNITKLYIWDYLKDVRRNKDMISYDEKEYKFRNNELKEEIKNNYNIDVYIYDQAVTYFDNTYVIPSYDDILINSRLTILKEILNSLKENERNKLGNIYICFEKSIIENNTNRNLYTVINNKNNMILLAFDITNDNFRNMVVEKINNLISQSSI